MLSHPHYCIELFIFVYDVCLDFIEVGREKVRNCGYQLLDESPDLFCDGEFDGLGRDFTEQATYGLVRLEPLDIRQQVVLQHV